MCSTLHQGINFYVIMLKNAVQGKKTKLRVSSYFHNRFFRKCVPQGLEIGRKLLENTKKPATSFPFHGPKMRLIIL